MLTCMASSDPQHNVPEPVWPDTTHAGPPALQLDQFIPRERMAHGILDLNLAPL